MFPAKVSLFLFLIILMSLNKSVKPFWYFDSDNDDKDINIEHDNKSNGENNNIVIESGNVYNEIDLCIDEPIERREKNAAVIVTAKVLELQTDPEKSDLRVAKVQIKRVFKGSDIIYAIENERRGVNSEDSFNKVISIYGIGEPSLCVNSVNIGDTRIFMLNLEYFGNLRISSSIIPISAYTLDRTDAAVKDIPFDEPPPKKSPCVGFFCPFHASCFINKTSGAPYCACLDDCSDYITSPVCGSDHKSYDNKCLLRLNSCRWQRRIKIRHEGKCRDPCDGVKCEGQQVCKLNKEREAVCQCEASCDQTVAPVCGSDGMTYSNECMLRQKACLEDREITVQYPAECRAGINADEYRDSLLHESQEPCRGVTCEFDAVCVVRNGNPTCECPECKDQYYDPVCDENGISHQNECMMQKENCEKRRNVQVEHRGLCMTEGCENNSTVCQFYSVCDSDGMVSRCVCPDHCEKTDDSVCGTDGVTYGSECELRVASCKQHMHIYIMSYGPCESCNGVKCKFGARCKNGKCVCPFLCPRQHEPVCASDGETYSNECEMRKAACQKNDELEIVSLGECEFPLEPGGSGEGSGDTEDCDETTCRFGGMCEHGRDGSYRCQCSFSCDAMRSPVCGSDGVTYGNPCELQTSSCEQQRHIVIQSPSSCDDMAEILCDGMPPVLNPRTGQEYMCTKGSDCPSDSYCHAQFGQCCQEERLSDTNIRDCTESEFGCCKDKVTFAPGPNYAGCPDQCHCNLVGSLGTTCNPVTKQCECKQGVGGKRCDSCYPGYWGLHLIQEQGNVGCLPCGCNEIGSERDDCHQMTGRCICRQGYDGLKCGLCSGSQARIGTYGCMGGHTPSPYTTRSRKTTRHIHSNTLDMTPKKPRATQRPPDDTTNYGMKYGRIGDVCLEHSYCTIPHSHCKLAICHCDEGYIPTMQNTQCSAVKGPGDLPLIPETADINQCTLNPCLNEGVCQLDDNLGYRCLCPLGKTGVICKQRSFFSTPSFSGFSYLVLQSLGNITGNFYLDIAFHTMNRDGILLFASEKLDGTGQFISLAISDSQVEFKFDMGSGTVQIRHPQKLTQNTYHQVIAKKLGQTAMLIIDGAEPMAAMIPSSRNYLDLSGNLFLGYLPTNLTFIQEKIGVSLGFVGCIQSLTAGHLDLARVYNLEYPSASSHIVDGLDIVPCENNPCQSIPCMNQGTCLVLGTDLFQCICPKGYTGSTCDAAVDLCTHSPCHESATCGISELGEVICFCPEGRQGQFCEYEKLKEVIVPEFTGDSFMLIPLHSNMAKQMSIEIWFLSKSHSGMLLFATQYLSGKGDSLSLNIVEKYLEFRFDLGDGPVRIRNPKQIQVGRWHRVLIQTKYKEGSLKLDDGEPVKASSQGLLKELQLSGVLYLGGYKNLSDTPTESGITRNFTGVLQRLYINGRQIENLEDEALEIYHVEEYHGQPCNINPCLNGGVCVPALEKADCRCPRRYFGKNCERVAENLEMNKPVRFDGKTYLQYFNEIAEMQNAQKTNKVKLKFRTHHTNGMLLYQGQGQAASDYLIVSIVNSHTELSFSLGIWDPVNHSPGSLGQDIFFKIRSSVYVSDGLWHTVIVERDKQEATLQVDGESPVRGTAKGVSTQLDTDGMLWIGGKPNLPWSLPREYSKGFKGCIGDVYINSFELNLFKHRKGQSNTIEFCH